MHDQHPSRTPPVQVLVPLSDAPGDIPPPGAADLARLVALGRTFSEASAAAGLDPSTAREILAWRGFQPLVRSFLPSHEDARTLFFTQVESSIQTLRDIRDDQTLRARRPDSVIRAAEALLDRAGHTPIRRVAIMAFQPDPERLALAARTALELAGPSGTPTEIPVETL